MRQNFTGSKDLVSIIKFVFFGPIRKPRWTPRPLIGRDISDFSFETAELNINSTKLIYMQQKLNVLCQVFVFSWSENKEGHRGLSLADTILLWHNKTEWDETLQTARTQ